MHVRENDTTMENLAAAMTAQSMTETTNRIPAFCREELMMLGESTRVSRITLLSGGRLPFRKLDNAVVQWVVASGSARVWIAQSERTVKAGDHVLIPPMATHAVEAFGYDPLVMTEVRQW